MLDEMDQCAWTACGGQSFEQASVSHKEPPYAIFKVAADTVLAFVLLVLSSPLLLVSMLLVKLTSPGPLIYSQKRLGRNRRPFTIYKIRTMHHDCERLTGPKWSTLDDPRITPVGRFLRKSHLDELPQLWNVLKGDMSLVGPRPERPEFVGPLEEALPRYADRLLVRPGVTGLAQIQLPADTDLESVRRKLACDLIYVQQYSFWLDLRILICTACFLAGIPFAASCRVLRIPSEAVDTDDSVRAIDQVEIVHKARPAWRDT